MLSAVSPLIGRAAGGVPSTHEGPTLQAQSPLFGSAPTHATGVRHQMQKQLLHSAQRGSVCFHLLQQNRHAILVTITPMHVVITTVIPPNHHYKRRAV